VLILPFCFFLSLTPQTSALFDDDGTPPLKKPKAPSPSSDGPFLLFEKDQVFFLEWPYQRKGVPQSSFGYPLLSRTTPDCAAWRDSVPQNCDPSFFAVLFLACLTSGRPLIFRHLLPYLQALPSLPPFLILAFYSLFSALTDPSDRCPPFPPVCPLVFLLALVEVRWPMKITFLITS